MLSEDRLMAQTYFPSPRFLPGAWMSIASNWSDGRNYFHWMLDSLTRLLVREVLPEPTRILLPGAANRFVVETLEMLGLRDQAEFPAAGCVRPERYYFCSPTSMTGVWNPLGFAWLKRQFAPYVAAATTGPPIFLTRRGGVRVPANLPAIEQCFTRHGFTIVDCGAIPVKEQIRLASMAPALAGLHGAAMTNLLWVHPRVPVLEIFQPQYLNACYEQIAFHGNLAYQSCILTSDHALGDIPTWCANLGL